ncbi:MAG TPA: tetratricopeptide repeat protein [Terriglobales bacterium]|nr:tetratricopeptide repeat protein [Terriglobales bacterium]
MASFTQENSLLPALALITLVAGTFILYEPVIHHNFINYDDGVYVSGNPRVLSGLSWKNITWAFTTTYFSNWHPLTWLSYMLVGQFSKADPAGYLLTNVILHTVNAALLFLVLYRGAGSLWRSFMVASMFAVHPLNVESVAWVSEQKNLLSMTFWLLAIWAYGWYVLKPNWKRYLAIAALFVLGLMSKPMVVTLPFVLLLLDYWPLNRMEIVSEKDSLTAKFLHLCLEKVPLFLLSCASAIITMIAQNSGGAIKSVAVYPFTVRLENALLAYAGYIYKTLWPSRLAIFYPHPGGSTPSWKIALAAILLTAITWLVFRFKQKRYLRVGWCFYLGTLVPVIGLIQIGNQAMADRYAYIPLIGLFLMIVWSIPEPAPTARVSNSMVRAVCLGVLLALSWSTRVQIGYWQDDIALFSHALEVNSNNVTAHVCLGTALAEEGRLDEAVHHFYTALMIKPNDEMAHFNLGAYRLYQGDREGALQEFQLALHYTSSNIVAANAHVQMAVIYSQMGRMEESKAHYRDAIQLDGMQYRAYLNLGVHLYLEGDTDGAISNISHSLEIIPTDAGYFYLAEALERENRSAEALAAYRQALKISPVPSEIQDHIDAILKKPKTPPEKNAH